ncbi:MAG: NAD(P)H nitroreductase [Neisseriaceae bacterium]|nr:MAG: NAD(P)H nitroreductase [Neisseriaceae bacterium]
MQDIISLVNSRYTCKDYDPTKKISADDIEKVKEILIKSPSSSNTQSSHFVMVESDEIKRKIADCSWEANYNRIVHASHVILFCGMNGYNERYLMEVYKQEKADGRFDKFTSEEAYFKNRASLYMSLPYSEQIAHIDAQVNIALGFFLLGIEGLGINATPMGGFVRGKVDQLLGLTDRRLHSVYLVSIGYAGEHDFNMGIKKSRLPEKTLITVM